MVQAAEKVYKVPNVTVDAIVTRSRLQQMLNKQMADQLKLYAQANDSFDSWEESYGKLRESIRQKCID